MAVDTKNLYPLSTPGGEPIPNEVYRPYGLLPVDVSDADSGTINIPTAATLLGFYSTVDCIVRFGAAASVPVSGSHLTDAFILPAYVFRTIDHNAAANLHVIGIDAGITGKLYVDTTKRWADIRKAAQHERG